MASAEPLTITCPACRQPIELPTRITLHRETAPATASFYVDLRPATDHALTHATDAA